MARTIRTPAQRAQQALDTHQRKIARIDKAIAHQREVLADYEGQRAALQARYDHLLADPDLPGQPDSAYNESEQP